VDIDIKKTNPKVTVEGALIDFKLLDTDNETLDKDIRAVIDEDSKEIALTVPFGTDVSSLVATIVLSTNVTIIESKDKETKFSSSISHTVNTKNDKNMISDEETILMHASDENEIGSEISITTNTITSSVLGISIDLSTSVFIVNEYANDNSFYKSSNESGLDNIVPIYGVSLGIRKKLYQSSFRNYIISLHGGFSTIGLDLIGNEFFDSPNLPLIYLLLGDSEITAMFNEKKTNSGIYLVKPYIKGKFYYPLNYSGILGNIGLGLKTDISKRFETGFGVEFMPYNRKLLLDNDDRYVEFANIGFEFFFIYNL